MVKKYNVKKHNVKNLENDKSDHVYHVVMDLKTDQYNILKNGVVLLKDWVYYIDDDICNLNNKAFTFIEVTQDQYNCVNRNGEFLFKDNFKGYMHFKNFARIVLNDNTNTLINSLGQILDTTFNETIYIENDVIENVKGVQFGKLGVDFKFINNK